MKRDLLTLALLAREIAPDTVEIRADDEDYRDLQAKEQALLNAVSGRVVH